jgi:hypothetical protein
MRKNYVKQNAHRIHNEEAFVQRSIGRNCSSDILQESWIGVKKMRIAQRNREAIIAIGYIDKAFGQTFTYILIEKVMLIVRNFRVKVKVFCKSLNFFSIKF